MPSYILRLGLCPRLHLEPHDCHVPELLSDPDYFYVRHSSGEGGGGWVAGRGQSQMEHMARHIEDVERSIMSKIPDSLYVSQLLCALDHCNSCCFTGS